MAHTKSMYSLTHKKDFDKRGGFKMSHPTQKNSCSIRNSSIFESLKPLKRRNPLMSYLEFSSLAKKTST